ncbi:MAG: hypothetical protein AAGC57_09600 [Pseudomonadota bacterium]
MRLVLSMALLAGLAACEAPDKQPLRVPDSAAEHAYLQCLGSDPYLLTTRCREVVAQIHRDPTPGLFAR